MKMSVRNMSRSSFICIVLTVCLTSPVYAGFNLAIPVPQVPAGTITIDGLPGDWSGVAPALGDQQGDSSCLGADIKAVYLAQDESYLYWRMDSWSGGFVFADKDAGPTIDIWQTSEPYEVGNVETRIFKTGGSTYANIWIWNGSGWQTIVSGPEYGRVALVAEGRIPLTLFNNSQYSYTAQYFFKGIDGDHCDDVAIDPLPDIDANGSDATVILQQGDNLNVTVSLDAGLHVGEDADWWRFLFYNTGDGLMRVPLANFQAPLFNLPTTTVVESTEFPPGSYLFIQGVDLNPNGVPDDPLYIDASLVIIQ